MASPFNLTNGLRRHSGVVPGSEVFNRLDDVDQVMRDSTTLIEGDLRRSDVEAAIDLHRIEVDDLAALSEREIEGEFTLARSRRPDYHGYQSRDGTTHRQIVAIAEDSGQFWAAGGRQQSSEAVPTASSVPTRRCPGQEDWWRSSFAGPLDQPDYSADKKQDPNNPADGL